MVLVQGGRAHRLCQPAILRGGGKQEQKGERRGEGADALSIPAT